MSMTWFRAEIYLSCALLAIGFLTFGLALSLENEAASSRLLDLAAAQGVEAARNSAHAHGSTVLLLGAPLLFLLALGALRLAARGVAAPLARLRGAAEAAARGETTAPPYASRDDDLGALARAVAACQERATEARRFRAALDASSAPTMIADADLTIVYVNPVLYRILEKSNAFWAARIPGFDFNDLIGRKIDIFHADRSKQRGMLARLETDHSAEIAFDGRILGFTATPIRGESGAKTGFVVQWRDLTEQRAMQREIGDVIEAVAAGDVGKRLNVASDDAFLAAIADGVNRVCAIVDALTAELMGTMTALADCDLTKRIETPYAGRFAALSQSANATVDRLAALVGEIHAASQRTRVATESIASDATELSARAESQASSLEETAATMEQMTAAIKSNSDAADGARGLASEASGRAERGGAVVEDAIAAMARIKESSERIVDISSVIDGIAFQTNLLALNAAVEAARAGDAGKGFAVVASEVRALAQRSADAAQDIKKLLQESATHVADGVDLARRTGASLAEIVDAVGRVSGTIDAISRSSREQAIGAEEIASAVSHMDELTQRNSSMAETSASEARSLAGEAKRLTELTVVSARAV